ncbi:hypothetical protein AJ80_07679 [Polytolypa hystricis UAMH7299]|uniref:20S-pre-rRNA D-site endonuclease NOB1 n=1 Tax=Polytolypa hystricis (strain UAMH7299) TaxID=1447883 RepID=A0A2B7XCM3_POLH7|nr:hypothetical protein AJ80_07679 [Polytolypa hystricis UAMH7299]
MAEPTTTDPGPPKPIHTLILDAGPLIKNIPPVSTLLSKSHSLLTTPAVISEIRDPVARQRVETLYLPFLTQRTPKPESLRVVAEFARKTGDRAVLSRQDLEIVALAYEVECERNGGDWRLRSEPGQKRINGMPPPPAKEEGEEKKEGEEEGKEEEGVDGEQKPVDEGDVVEAIADDLQATKLESTEDEQQPAQQAPVETEGNKKEVKFTEPQAEDNESPEAEEEVEDEDEKIDESDSDADGWITPSNIKKRQARDAAKEEGSSAENKTMQVATLTTDFAMQNVLLQMNLNLLSDRTMQRIRHLKSYILRCHGCFATTKDMEKQFCPRCGRPTLNRVACSTSASGVFKLHLKRNMQWNTRGNVFSVPKPTAGSSNGKWKGGGGQGGWGSELVFAEDQKEYVRSVEEEGRSRRKERDLMDADYLPGILTGERQKGGGRAKVGAGRNVNSKKRR